MLKHKNGEAKPLPQFVVVLYPSPLLSTLRLWAVASVVALYPSPLGSTPYHPSLCSALRRWVLPFTLHHCVLSSAVRFYHSLSGFGLYPSSSVVETVSPSWNSYYRRGALIVIVEPILSSWSSEFVSLS